jgi:hypothetical protein
LLPSFVVRLYETHFKLDHLVRHREFNRCAISQPKQAETFAYEGPMKIFLEAIEQRKLLPDFLDLLDDAQVPFYDGTFLRIFSLAKLAAGRMFDG